MNFRFNQRLVTNFQECTSQCNCNSVEAARYNCTRHDCWYHMKFVTTWANRTRGHPATYQKKTWRMLFFRKFDGSLRNVTSWIFLLGWEKPGVTYCGQITCSTISSWKFGAPFFWSQQKIIISWFSWQKSVVPTCTRMKKPLWFLAASSWSLLKTQFCRWKKKRSIPNIRLDWGRWGLLTVS